MALDSTTLTRARRWRRAAVGAAATLVCFVVQAGAVHRMQPTPPQRIVSVIPAVTEILFAVGAGPQVVGVSSYDSTPPEVNRLPRVGGLIDPDIETIISLRPDLVVAYDTQIDLLEQLARADIPVAEYTHGTLADVLDTIRTLGARTGHAANAERAARRIEADLAAIRERVGRRERPRVVLVFAREPYSLRNLFASGGVGFLHDVLEAAGGRNVFGDIMRPAVQANTEALLAAAPDVVIEVRSGAEMADENVDQEIRVWQALPGLPAVRNGRVRFLIGSDFVVPGPRVADAAARLARVLHPEAFEPN